MRSSSPVLLLVTFLTLSGVHQSLSVQPGADRVLVEWLEWRGEELVALSRREFPGGTTFAVSVSRSPNAFLRFSRAGATPVTLSTLALPADNLRLPEPEPGGEVIARVPSGPADGAAYELVRGRIQLPLQLDGRGHAVARAIAPGRYALQAIFEGNRRLDAGTVEVVAGRTTPLAAVLPPIGAIRLRATPERCFETKDIVVSRRRIARGGGVVSRPVVRLVHENECNRAILGLVPDEYRVELTDRDRSILMFDDVQVVAGQVSDVEFIDPLVVVKGVVTQRGEPFGATRSSLVFIRESGEPGQVAAQVNIGSAGAFEAILDRPGNYGIKLVTAGHVLVPGIERRAALRRGFNSLDVDLTGAVVNVDIKNWDRSSDVTLAASRLSSVTIGETTRAETRLSAADAVLPVSMPGLASESYELQARQRRPNGQQLVSAVSAFTIGPDDSNVDVELLLRDYVALVTLLDPEGRPVTGATVTSLGLGRLKEREPGVFVADAARAGPGSSLLITSPGFTPECRTAPFGRELAVTLDRGMSREVRFRGLAGLGAPPGFLQWDGSTCPISLAHFASATLSRGEAGSTSAFQIENFPGAPRVFWMRDSATVPQRVVSDPGGFLVVDLHGRQ